jgi:hypothetical protein
VASSDAHEMCAHNRGCDFFFTPGIQCERRDFCLWLRPTHMKCAPTVVGGDFFFTPGIQCERHDVRLWLRPTHMKCAPTIVGGDFFLTPGDSVREARRPPVASSDAHEMCAHNRGCSRTFVRPQSWVLTNLRVGKSVSTIRFYRKRDGSSTYRLLRKKGKLHVVRQATPWSLTATFGERLHDGLVSLLPGK